MDAVQLREARQHASHRRGLEKVQMDLRAVDELRPLRHYRIPHALPAQPPGWLDPVARELTHPSGLFVTGDHRETASSHGALSAGRRAAEAVLGAA